ncbi:MAG: hypothetical protein GX437_08700 [Sphingobacteriales bacterium]|nr:hypothetical protein [Sphingobacteriales bacterium]
MKKRNSLIILKINKKQATDAGMAMVLLLLLIGFFGHNTLYFRLAIPVLVMLMIFPMLFYPFAVIWFSLAQLLGIIFSKIILTISYVIIVLPVAFIRRLTGKDSLQLRQFKKSASSVMISRDHWFKKEDFETPY